MPEMGDQQSLRVAHLRGQIMGGRPLVLLATMASGEISVSTRYIMRVLVQVAPGSPQSVVRVGDVCKRSRAVQTFKHILFSGAVNCSQLISSSRIPPATSGFLQSGSARYRTARYHDQSGEMSGNPHAHQSGAQYRKLLVCMVFSCGSFQCQRHALTATTHSVASPFCALRRAIS